MILYVVFRRNKSVDFTLVFSLLSIFFRFLIGKRLFSTPRRADRLWTPNHPYIQWAWGGSFFGGGGEGSSQGTWRYLPS